MTYYSLNYKPGWGYYWQGSSCWGHSETDGYWSNRNDALMRKPFGAGDDWEDNTGDGPDAPREFVW